jgi:hypothetical protein
LGTYPNIYRYRAAYLIVCMFSQGGRVWVGEKTAAIKRSIIFFSDGFGGRPRTIPSVE